MDNEIYVVRWLKVIGDESFCGTFETAYRNEADAEAAMLKDMEQVKADWAETASQIDGKVACEIGDKEEDGYADFCSVWFEGDCLDHHEWYIDKLEIV